MPDSQVHRDCKVFSLCNLQAIKFMYGDLNQSSYYRANPYYQQGYMPDTAFKNRKMPSYMVEIPQGEQFFEPTNKKHFQRLGYYSTIGQEHIMDPDPTKSPATTQKTYFRNLNVEDIDGAGTNTLISKAVKNRMKAKEYLQEREREKKQQELRQKMRSIQQAEDQRKRMEALSKINRGKQPNYHQKVMKLKTEDSQKFSPPQVSKYDPPEAKLQREQLSPIQHYHQKQYDSYQTELDKTEREIRELQSQLRGKVQAESYNQKGNTNFLSSDKQHPYAPNNSIVRNSLPDQYSTKETQPYSGRPAQAPDFQYRLSERAGLSQPLQLNGSGELPVRKDIQNYRNFSGSIETQNKLRSYTDNKATGTSNHEQIYGQAQRGGGTPVYQQQGSGRANREQHRRINPTYLSYGSASIGLAGRNIIGY